METTARDAPNTNHGYGSLWELRRIRNQPIAFLQQLATSGDLSPFAFRGQRGLLVNDPRVIEQVLVAAQQKFVKPPALQRATRLLGQGLLTAPGPLHTARRRLAQPAFHRRRIEGYGDAMVARAVARAEGWRAGQPIDISVEMSELTLSIVGDTLFSGDLMPYATELRRIVARASDSFDPLVALVAPMRRLRPERDRLDAIVNELISQRLQAPGERDDVLDMLIAGSADSTREQLHDDALTLLLAGFDTISNALTWTWTFLADHPAVDEAMGHEVARVIGNRRPTAADLGALANVKAAFAESLRLRPPAWILARLAVETLELETGEIAAGTLVLMSPYLMHRDPRFFSDPLTFQPARWLDAGSSTARPRFSYFPFGGGKRSCIGESFALMEAALVLATISQRWRLRAVSGQSDVDARITLRPSGPVVMVPEPRVP